MQALLVLLEEFLEKVLICEYSFLSFYLIYEVLFNEYVYIGIKIYSQISFSEDIIQKMHYRNHLIFFNSVISSLKNNLGMILNSLYICTLQFYIEIPVFIVNELKTFKDTFSFSTNKTSVKIILMVWNKDLDRMLM